MHSLALALDHAPIHGCRARPLQLVPRRVDAKERQFAVLVHAFARSGGIVSGDDVAVRMRRHTTQPLSALARLIVRRELLSFAWRGEILLPMFQFDPVDMSLRAGVTESVTALSGVLDDWALVRWFAEPHTALQGEAPADRLSDVGAEVGRAARLSRLRLDAETREHVARPLDMATR